MSTDWPEDAPKGAQYLAFPANEDEDKAADRFMLKYGLEPEYIFTARQCLLVGPIPEVDDDEV